MRLTPTVSGRPEETAKLLEDLGHVVEPAAPSFDVETMFDGWTKIFQANEAWAFDGYAEATGQTPSSENTEANNLNLLGRREGS